MIIMLNKFTILKAIIQKMEEENKVNSYMVNQKYPKELNMYKQKLKDYESILSKSAVTQSDLNDIKTKVCAFRFNSYFF
jgi:intraflagellar transport protein 81